MAAVRKVQCEMSPTGAHHRYCRFIEIANLDHPHEAQDCKYCGDRLMTPCWRCRDREEEKKVAAATKRPIRLVKKAS